MTQEKSLEEMFLEKSNHGVTPHEMEISLAFLGGRLFEMCTPYSKQRIIVKIVKSEPL